MEIGTGEKKRRRGRGEERKKHLKANPRILQNAFAHKCGALIGVDGSDVCQLLVSHISDVVFKMANHSIFDECLWKVLDVLAEHGFSQSLS